MCSFWSYVAHLTCQVAQGCLVKLLAVGECARSIAFRMDKVFSLAGREGRRVGFSWWHFSLAQDLTFLRRLIFAQGLNSMYRQGAFALCHVSGVLRHVPFLGHAGADLWRLSCGTWANAGCAPCIAPLGVLRFAGLGILTHNALACLNLQLSPPRSCSFACCELRHTFTSGGLPEARAGEVGLDCLKELALVKLKFTTFFTSAKDG